MTIAVISSCLLFSGTAAAHQLPHKRPIKQLSLKQQYNYYLRSYRHGDYVYRWWRNHYPGRITKDRSFHWRLRKNAKRNLAIVKRKLVLPPHYNEWLCIHSGEGSWDSNTGNGYYGGLQMDYTFMQTYGGHLLRTKGTADNWTPIEQMWVAEKAHRSGRGFNPWPNTARNCGLL